MPKTITCFVENSAKRVREARAIADKVRGDEQVHRLAMNAVFVLEDCHESFVRLRDQVRSNGNKNAG